MNWHPWWVRQVTVMVGYNEAGELAHTPQQSRWAFRPDLYDAMQQASVRRPRYGTETERRMAGSDGRICRSAP